MTKCYCSDHLEFDVFLRGFQRKNRSLTAKITLLRIVEWDFRKLLSAPSRGREQKLVLFFCRLRQGNNFTSSLF